MATTVPPARVRRARARTILERAGARGETTLSEHDSKRLIATYGVPVTREALARTPAEAVRAARRLGYPVALKVSAAGEAHKTERGLVALGLSGDREVRAAFATLRDRAGRDHGVDVLVQEMVRGSRELVIGMTRDAQFGPCVMFGLGGVFTEILGDVVFRVAPLTRRDALTMLDGIRARRVLDAVRGMPPVDRAALAASLVGIGRLALDHPRITAIDVNPLIVAGARPVAVDALVVLA